MAITEDEVIENRARKLRKELGIDDRFCPDLIFVLNEMKRVGKLGDFVRVPRTKMANDEARYDAIENVLYIRDDVFGALDHPYNEAKRTRRRARFTVAHELAHVALGHNGTRFRGTSGALAKKIDLDTRSDEFEAHKFGAAFLMPSHLADAYRSAEDIADLFDVNISAADIRRETLQKLDRRARGATRALPSSIVDYLQAAKAKGYKVTSLDDEERRRTAAIAKGYEGRRCTSCGNFTLRCKENGIQCETCNKMED
jgi:Zn-dependent peptidase ImmA (M78 family)